jgi:hypothetical protein
VDSVCFRYHAPENSMGFWYIFGSLIDNFELLFNTSKESISEVSLLLEIVNSERSLWFDILAKLQMYLGIIIQT